MLVFKAVIVVGIDVGSFIDEVIPVFNDMTGMADFFSMTERFFFTVIVTRSFAFILRLDQKNWFSRNSPTRSTTAFQA